MIKGEITTFENVTKYKEARNKMGDVSGLKTSVNKIK